MAKMNSVIHFEMPAEDKKRMSKFYNKAFGWQTQQLGPEMNEYVVVTTSETDEKGRPKKPGTINGGFYQKSADLKYQYPSLVIGVEDIRESVQKVKAAGGTISGEIMQIPGVGQFVSFIDTEGNHLSMLQPLGDM